MVKENKNTLVEMKSYWMLKQVGHTATALTNSWM